MLSPLSTKNVPNMSTNVHQNVPEQEACHITLLMWVDQNILYASLPASDFWLLFPLQMCIYVVLQLYPISIIQLELFWYNAVRHERRDIFPCALQMLWHCVGFECYICALHLSATFVCFICLLHLCATIVCYICVLHLFATFVCYICVLHLSATCVCYIFVLHFCATFVCSKCFDIVWDLSVRHLRLSLSSCDRAQCHNSCAVGHMQGIPRTF